MLADEKLIKVTEVYIIWHKNYNKFHYVILVVPDALFTPSHFTLPNTISELLFLPVISDSLCDLFVDLQPYNQSSCLPNK